MFKFLSFLGMPWSVYVIRNGNELIAAAHVASPIAALGVIGIWVEDYGDPVAPYSIGLNFNKDHTFVPLISENFDSFGYPKNDLVSQLAIIDPKCLKRRSYEENPIPYFTEPATKRQLSQSVVTDIIYNKSGN